MKYVFLTAIGVGGATIIGALLGFLFKKPSHKLSDYITSFAAGVMLCAAIVGLVLPSLEYGDGFLPIIITVIGIFLGAYALNIIDKIIPHLHKVTGVGENISSEKTKDLDKVLLFVLAVAIHNFPEGIAAGVSFGGEISKAISVSGGIALQNIPEGMVIIAPLVVAGVSKRRTFLIAFATGFIEVVGTFIGYFAISLSTAILPFALAFAGGTMLYVISDEMIPETHSHGNERGATYSLLGGFALMLIFDFIMR